MIKSIKDLFLAEKCARKNIETLYSNGYKVCKVEKLTVVVNDTPPLVEVEIFNGSNRVYHEWHDFCGPSDAIIEALWLMGYYAKDKIVSLMSDVCEEYDGKLISGKLPGFKNLNYFKQVDNCPLFYRHFTHRPSM